MIYFGFFCHYCDRTDHNRREAKWEKGGGGGGGKSGKVPESAFENGTPVVQWRCMPAARCAAHKAISTDNVFLSCGWSRLIETFIVQTVSPNPLFVHIWLESDLSDWLSTVCIATVHVFYKKRLTCLRFTWREKVAYAKKLRKIRSEWSHWSRFPEMWFEYHIYLDPFWIIFNLCTEQTGLWWCSQHGTALHPATS